MSDRDEWRADVSRLTEADRYHAAEELGEDSDWTGVAPVSQVMKADNS